MRKFQMIIVLFTFVLSGCATTSGSNLTCDFVGGTYESEEKERQKQEIYRDEGYRGELDEAGDRSHVVNGILNALVGVIDRYANDSEEDDCT